MDNPRHRGGMPSHPHDSPSSVRILQLSKFFPPVRGGIETAAAGGVHVPWAYAAPAIPVTVGWLGFWWWFALSRGFQLSMAWAIWGLLMLISVLVAVIVAMYASRLTNPWY